MFNFELHKLETCSSWPKHIANRSREVHIVCIRRWNWQKHQTSLWCCPTSVTANVCRALSSLSSAQTYQEEIEGVCLYFQDFSITCSTLKATQHTSWLWPPRSHVLLGLKEAANPSISLASFQLLHEPLNILSTGLFVYSVSLSCICKLLH